MGVERRGLDSVDDDAVGSDDRAPRLVHRLRLEGRARDPQRGQLLPGQSLRRGEVVAPRLGRHRRQDAPRLVLVVQDADALQPIRLLDLLQGEPLARRLLQDAHCGKEKWASLG